MTEELLRELGITPEDLEVLRWKVQQVLKAWKQEQRREENWIAPCVKQVQEAEADRQARAASCREAYAARERVAAEHFDIDRYALFAFQDHPEVKAAAKRGDYYTAIRTAYNLAKQGLT